MLHLIYALINLFAAYMVFDSIDVRQNSGMCITMAGFIMSINLFAFAINFGIFIVILFSL